MMKKITLLLSALLLLSVGVRAQLRAENPDFSDTTRYWAPVASDTTHFTPLSRRQDSIFVFFNRHGALTASQPQGRPVRFTWQVLDTASLTFKTVRVDTVEVERRVIDFFTQMERDSSRCDSFPQQIIYSSKRNTSKLDSAGVGCYRLLTDTLKTLYDTVRCDSLYTVYPSAGAGGADSAAYVKASVLIPRDTLAVAADTFVAWVFIDTFRIDTIVQEGPDCSELKLQAVFYPASEGYYQYAYINLWRTPRRDELKYPDCNDCYIKRVTWTATPDIHEGVEVSDGDSWKKSYIAFIPTPFHDAKYKVVVENYFGARDTLETGVIEAKAVHAQLKLFAESLGKDGAREWKEKAGKEEEPEMSPVNVYLANASINAGDSATFTWEFLANLYEQEDSTALPPRVWQFITYDSAETVSPPEPYRPGRYPMTLLVSNRHGCVDSDTITLEVAEFLIEPDAIPPLFTPNGDGKNDTYQLKDPENKVHSVEEIEVSIFNRYGQLVFRSRDVRFAWDGKLRGANSPAPDGVYFYVIRAQGYSKQRKKVAQTLKGNIHLFNGK
jgi:gliding motility-associated-like protein